MPRVIPCLPILCLLGGCFSHTITVEPIEVKTIHMTVDINLKVQRELEKFFDFEDDAKQKDAPASQASRKN